MAANLVNSALEAFGDLHVLVNNAGILRDRVLVNLSEDDWDDVIQRSPQGTLRPHPPRRRLLARAGQGGKDGTGLGHQHVVHLRAPRQCRPVELWRGQGRYRRLHRDHR